MSEPWGPFRERLPRNQFSKPGGIPRAEAETLPRDRKIQAGLDHLLSFVGGVRSAQDQRAPVLSCRAMPFQLLRRSSGKCRASCLLDEWGQGEGKSRAPSPPAQVAGSLPCCETGTPPSYPNPPQPLGNISHLLDPKTRGISPSSNFSGKGRSLSA